MPVCYSCSKELSESKLYCRKCGVRTRCGNCRGLLEAGDEFCGDCGTAVDTPAQPSGPTQIEKTGGDFNVINYVDKNSTFNAKLSDRAFESGSEIVGAFLVGRMTNPIRRIKQSNNGEELLDVQPNLSGIDTDGVDEHDQTQDSPARALPASSDASRLGEIFRISGNDLRLVNPRLKQRTKGDFQCRLSVLFLYAHELAGRDMISRDELKSLLQDAKVYDGNARKWIGNNEHLIRDGDLLGLSVPGREFAKNILIQIRDPNIDTSWTVGTKGKSRNPKGNKGDDTTVSDDSGKSGKSRKAPGTSYRAMTRKLYEDGYFSEPRTSAEAREELVTRGYTFPMGRISEALMVLLKGEQLTREKNGAGDWAYKNK
jgi:hypothetical protein